MNYSNSLDLFDSLLGHHYLSFEDRINVEESISQVFPSLSFFLLFFKRV